MTSATRHRHHNDDDDDDDDDKRSGTDTSTFIQPVACSSRLMSTHEAWDVKLYYTIPYHTRHTRPITVR